MLAIQEQYLGGLWASASEMSSVSETGTHLEHSALQLLQETTPSGGRGHGWMEGREGGRRVEGRRRKEKKVENNDVD